MGVMKTPGVYIVEKNAFPNSVVEVGTAVPTFVGHTAWADNQNTPLTLKPWPISSMAEYHQYFGGPPTPRFTLVEETDLLKAQFQAWSKPDTPASKKGYRLEQGTGAAGGNYGLYNALRHFFQNGGGRCYIVSVGDYAKDLDADQFQAGIDALKKEQEPTMLVVPEAVRFDADACKDIQQAMLKHCGYEMRNRVAILDVWGGDQPRDNPVDPVAKFRDNLGINFLDFASSYYPWLNTSVVGEKEIDYENIQLESRDLLATLIRAELNLPQSLDKDAPPNVKAMFDEVARLKADFKAVVEGEEIKRRDAAAVKPDREKLLSDAKTAGKTAEEIKAEQDAFDRQLPDLVAKKRAEARAAFKADYSEALKKDPKAKPEDVEVKAEAAAKDWDDAYDHPLGSDALATAVKVRRDLLNKTLAGASQVYKAVLAEVRRQLNVLPPSAAMAGVYTMTDNTRGVWKAPANVSLNGVISPTVSISAEQQEDLNVSAQGKSINAIRSFIGEGVLVWGARTLDGNSLDWRYINVRRTMIMLEESCRLAAKAMVFEPNTANTWVTIKSMISNFLTSVWKRGGLMGAVPEDAFSVHVGLVETMTPNDILEGILRVTVLVAMVRPAEFIEITFQQQMPKS